MTATSGIGLAALREPFAANLVGKLPRVTCRECSDSRSRVCDKHTKSKCAVCDQWISSAHMHLDFVGHAALTDRFLDVDPMWTWEPLAVDGHGLPTFDQYGGLWIKLTICGVTRLGYGDAQGKTGPNAVKEAIGDALRNAGMRFGAALDLWHKGDLHAPEANPALDAEHRQPPAGRKAQRQKGQQPPDDFALRSDPAALNEWIQTVHACQDKDALSAAWANLNALVACGQIVEADKERCVAAWTARRDEVIPSDGADPAPSEGWPDVAEPGSAA